MNFYSHVHYERGPNSEMAKRRAIHLCYGFRMNETILHITNTMYIQSSKTGSYTLQLSNKYFLYIIEVKKNQIFGSYSVNLELLTF